MILVIEDHTYWIYDPFWTFQIEVKLKYPKNYSNYNLVGKGILEPSELLRSCSKVLSRALNFLWNSWKRFVGLKGPGSVPDQTWTSLSAAFGQIRIGFPDLNSGDGDTGINSRGRRLTIRRLTPQSLYFAELWPPAPEVKNNATVGASNVNGNSMSFKKVKEKDVRV